VLQHRVSVRPVCCAAHCALRANYSPYWIRSGSVCWDYSWTPTWIVLVFITCELIAEVLFAGAYHTQMQLRKIENIVDFLLWTFMKKQQQQQQNSWIVLQNILFCFPYGIKGVIQVWNNMRVSKWYKLNFWFNYPKSAKLK